MRFFKRPLFQSKISIHRIQFVRVGDSNTKEAKWIELWLVIYHDSIRFPANGCVQ